MKFLVASFLAIILIAAVEIQGETDALTIRLRNAGKELSEAINYWKRVGSETRTSSSFIRLRNAVDRLKTAIKEGEDVLRLHALSLTSSPEKEVVKDNGQTSFALTGVERGFNSGQEIGNILTHVSSMTKSESFSKIAKMGKFMAPFLGSFGTFISLASIFTTSPEIALMKKAFFKIDRNFDEVFKQLGEIKKEVLESSMRAQYASYEQKIITLSGYMNDYLKTNSNGTKDDFIRNYKSYYDDSATQLLNGMMKRYSIAYNIPNHVMKYTKYHTRKTQLMMADVVALIMRGCMVELLYTKLEQSEKDYLRKETSWINKIYDLVSHVEYKSNQVKSHWDSVFKQDIVETLKWNTAKSNEEFGNYLYSFLKGKYDWRDWNVVTYNPIRGADVHWVGWRSYGGYHSFRTHGRNLVVASVEDTEDPIDKYSTERRLRRVKTTVSVCGGNAWGGGCSHGVMGNARDIFRNRMPSGFAARGVIDKNADVSNIGNKDRLVWVNNRYFHLYAFK